MFKKHQIGQYRGNKRKNIKRYSQKDIENTISILAFILYKSQSHLCVLSSVSYSELYVLWVILTVVLKEEGAMVETKK